MKMLSKSNFQIKVLRYVENRIIVTTIIMKFDQIFKNRAVIRLNIVKKRRIKVCLYGRNFSKITLS